MGREGVAMKLFPTPPNYSSCPCPPSEHKTGFMSPFSAYPHVESRPTVKMTKWPSVSPSCPSCSPPLWE